MRVVVIGLILAAMVIAAGYYGFAGYIASGLMVLTLFFGALTILGSIAGGVKVSPPRRTGPRLVARARRSAA